MQNGKNGTGRSHWSFFKPFVFQGLDLVQLELSFHFQILSSPSSTTLKTLLCLYVRFVELFWEQSRSLSFFHRSILLFCYSKGSPCSCVNCSWSGRIWLVFKEVVSVCSCHLDNGNILRQIVFMPFAPESPCCRAGTGLTDYCGPEWITDILEPHSSFTVREIDPIMTLIGIISICRVSPSYWSWSMYKQHCWLVIWLHTA